MIDVLDTNDYLTWNDVRPIIRETHIGYNLHDLRSLWVVTCKFTPRVYGFLLTRITDDNRPVWGELFMDDMMVLNYRQAKEVAAFFRKPHIQAARLRTHLGR